MKIGGLDVGRRFDKTTYLELNGSGITDIVQPGGIRFKEQATFLYSRLRSCELILVDVTGIGQALYECLEELKLPVLPVTITAGDKMRVNEGRVSVGKQFLIQNISINMNTLNTVKLPKNMRQAFRQELASFVVKLGKSCNKFEAKSGHDDMVIALGLALLGVLISDRQDQIASDEGRFGRQEGEGRIASYNGQGNGAGSSEAGRRQEA